MQETHTERKTILLVGFSQNSQKHYTTERFYLNVFQGIVTRLKKKKKKKVCSFSSQRTTMSTNILIMCTSKENRACQNKTRLVQKQLCGPMQLNAVCDDNLRGSIPFHSRVPAPHLTPPTLLPPPSPRPLPHPHPPIAHSSHLALKPNTPHRARDHYAPTAFSDPSASGQQPDTPPSPSCCLFCFAGS